MRAEAVQQQHVGPLAHRQRRDPQRARPATSWMRSSGGRPFGRRNRPSKPTREVEVAAGVEAALRERLDAGELALAQRAARSRRRCRSRRRARGWSPRRARGRRAWCSGPPSVWPDVAQADVVGGVEARLGARGSGSGACGTPPATSRRERRDIGARTYPRRRGRTGTLPLRARRSACTTRAPAASLQPLASRATPARSGIYACGPTVYARVHVGNARPFVVFSPAQALPRARGLRASTLVPTSPTSTTRSTTRRATAGRAVGRAGARDDRRTTSPTPTGSGSAGPTTSRWRPSTSSRSSTLIADAGRRAATPTRRAATSTSACARCPSYGELSHRDVDQMDQGEGVEGADRKEDPLDFALWKAHEAGRGHRLGRRRGARAGPGWHIECSAMAEELLGRRVRHPRRRHRPRLPAPRERGGADAGRARAAARAASGCTTGCSQLGRREDVQVGRATSAGSARCSTRSGATRWSCTSSAATTASRSPSRASGSRTRRARRASGSATPARRLVPRRRRRRTLAPLRDAFFDALADDFNTAAGAGARCSTGSARPTGATGRSATRTCARCSSVLGLENLLERDAEGRRPRSSSWPSGAPRPARARDFAEADRLRDELRARGLGGPRRPGRARSCVPRRAVIVYGRNAGRARRCAGRAARSAAVWATRGRGPRAWAPAARGRATRRRRSRARCGSDAHQGVCAEVEDVPLRRRRRAARGARARCSSRSTRSPTRRTSARSAARPSAPGATGVIIPERRSAEVTPAVCKASAGAVEHLRDRAACATSPTSSRDAKAAGCWVYGAAAGARTPVPAPDYRGGVVLVLGAEGRGLRPRVRRRVRRPRRRCRCAGASNRST